MPFTLVTSGVLGEETSDTSAGCVVGDGEEPVIHICLEALCDKGVAVDADASDCTENAEEFPIRALLGVNRP